MSKYDKRLHKFFTNGYSQGYCPVSTQDELLFHLYFDESVDTDIKEYEDQLPQARLLKKVCTIKCILYPLELLLARILLGKIWYNERKEQQYFYSRARKMKINISDFQEGLNNLADKYYKLKGGK